MSDHKLENDELMHYGVLGTKWGVHRSLAKQKQNARLENKALRYDVKSAKAERKLQIIKHISPLQKKKISQITPEDISGAYSFVNELLKSA